MVDSVDDKKKVGGVDKTTKLTDIQKTEAVSNVNATSRVDTVSNETPRGLTREMTAAERDAMLALVRKEAESMFANSNLSKDQTAAIEMAVQKTLDASIIVKDEDEDANEHEKQG